MTEPTATATPAPAEKVRGRDKRPSPGGPDSLTYQLRSLIKFIVDRDGITLYEVAGRSEVDPKVLARFMNIDSGRGLSLATADRIAMAFRLGLDFRAKEETKTKTKRLDNRGKASKPGE